MDKAKEKKQQKSFKKSIKKMAFEERCSPQSAPSPPGMPHSPHNNAMLCSDMNSIGSSPTSPEMALDVCSDRVSPAIIIKQEEDHNNTSNQPEASISFSITNILSNSFGKVTRKSTGERKSSLFRPYDPDAVPKQPASPTSPQKSPIEELHQNVAVQFENGHHAFSAVPPKYNGILDYSHRAANAFLHNNNIEHAKFLQFYTHHHQSQLQLAAATSLYNTRLHEDILNSKKYHQYYQPTPLLPENVLSKIPPLGNLCKTVSQIGQPSAPTAIPVKTPQPIPPPKKVNQLNSESAERLEVAVNMQQKEHQQKSQQQQQQQQQQSNSLDSGLDSSDDAKSESGSTKDENGSSMWPAWIYCTRYSDRPSSGNIMTIIYIKIIFIQLGLLLLFDIQLLLLPLKRFIYV